MTSRIIHNQTKTHGRDMGLSLCGGESRAPMPACGQGGVHSFPIGASSFRSSRLLDAPPLTGRGLTRSGLFSYSRCARRVLPDAAPGRFARGPLIGRTVCKFCRAIERRGSLLCLRQHVRYHTADAAKCHSIRRLSSWAGFDDQQPNERPFTRVQEPFAFGATDHE